MPVQKKQLSKSTATATKPTTKSLKTAAPSASKVVTASVRRTAMKAL